MKSRGLIIFLISLLVLLVLGLVAFMVVVLSGKFRFNINFFNSESKNQIIDKTYEGNYKNISIKSNEGNIYIEKNDTNTFKVVVYSEKEDTKVEENEEKLTITDDSKCKGFCFNRKISKIIVYIPEEYEGDINIDDKTGDIRIKTDINSNLNVTTDVGDIRTKKVNNADIKTKVGDIRIDEITNRCDLETDTGDIRVEKVDLKEDSKMKTDVGDIRIYGTNEIYIDAKKDVGDIKINHNYRESKVELKLETDVGDIKVKN